MAPLLFSSRTAFRIATWMAVLAVLLLAGCKSSRKKRPGAEGYHELLRSQQQAVMIEQAQAPAIYVRGAVQSPVIAWREGITLAEALLEAGYTNALSPRTIRVTRAGRVYPIDVRRLLRGTENPVLEPNDVIEVQR